MDSKLFNYAKSPIPVLNNNAPHNYQIMSALLSNIDSSLTLNQTDSSYLISNSYSKNSNRIYDSNQQYFQNGIKINSQPSTSRTLSSKEIIYTTKRRKLLNLNNQNALFLNNDNNSNSNIQIVEEVQEDLSQENTYETNLDNQLNISSNIDTSSLINSSSVSLINSDFVNTFVIPDILNNNNNNSNNGNNQSSIQNQPDYATIFNESQSNNIIDNNQTYQVTEEEKSQRKENTNNYEEQVSESNNHSLITYTISCPSDWQFNLNQMINCFISLNKDIKNLNKIKLKCSVCKIVFDNLNDLADHKELNFNCKNGLNIESNLQNKKNNELLKINKKKLDTCNNYYIDEDIEDDEEEQIEEQDEEYDYLNEQEANEENFFDEELNQENENHIDELDSSLNDDSNENQHIYGNLKKKDIVYNNKIISKIKLKNNIKFKLKNSSSSSSSSSVDEKESNLKITQIAKPVRARRKYTKSKATPVANLTCEKCNKTCRTKAELLVHLHKHAGNGAECWECGKKCASFSNLVSHVQLHTGEKPYTCQFCGKQFTQDAHLTRHIRLHTGERPFVCNICGKNYKDYSYYKTHLRIHRGERLYKCNYCNKEYYDASYYKKHTRLHTGEKPYMCTVCGRQFHRSDYLKLHSYSHTDERPFNCHICGKGFKMNYNLKVHLKNHENQEQINQSSSSLINSSNDETCSFNDSNQLSNNEIVTLNENIDNNAIMTIVNANDFGTNELLFASNTIGLDANTIQIINNSANNNHIEYRFN